MRSRADAAPSWLWVPSLPAVGGELVFEADAAHYLRRVVRAREGEQLRLTDGAGGVAHARLLVDGRAVIERLAQAPRPDALSIACGAPEGERADWLVEKLAELGVAELVPVDSERASWEGFTRRRERWERLATAAIRQSRQPWRLTIAEPLVLARWLACAPQGASWLADGGGDRAGERLAVGGRAAGLVGPSSGFTTAERDAIVGAGFHPMRLASARLRTETAALSIAALWAAGREAPADPLASADLGG